MNAQSESRHGIHAPGVWASNADSSPDYDGFAARVAAETGAVRFKGGS